MESTTNAAPYREGQRAPGTYLLTFVCYGAKLHGEAGAVNRWHNVQGTPRIQENPTRAAFQRQLMNQPPYTLDGIRRSITLTAIQKVCAARVWLLLAAHVRTNHVHVVIESDAPPETVMSTLKSSASRALNELGIDEQEHRRRWARHGSTRYIWTKAQLSAAIRYTVSGQGERLSVYEAP
jgi:REP element-mobilizing transposase RayT